MANEAGLGLASFPQQDEVVAGQDAPLQRGQYRVVEADDRGEQRLPLLQSIQEVLAELILDGAVGIPGGSKLGDRRRPGSIVRYGGIGHGVQGTGKPWNGSRSGGRASGHAGGTSGRCPAKASRRWRLSGTWPKEAMPTATPRSDHMRMSLPRSSEKLSAWPLHSKRPPGTATPSESTSFGEPNRRRCEHA